MHVKLSYYGQKKRDFDIDVGDMLTWVAVDGRFGTGLVLDFVTDPHKVTLLKLLVDVDVKVINPNLFFLLRVVNKESSSEEK